MKRGKRLKPFDELTPYGKKQRLQRENMNPEQIEKRRQMLRAYYLKNKHKQQIQKQKLNKKRSQEAVELLGGKCMSCGEIYNPTARRSNLEMDHLSYFRSGRKSFYYYDVFELQKKGIDPKERFALLCHTCHMIDTHIRKNPQKAVSQIQRLLKLGVIKFEHATKNSQN